ncbi:MAG TPA: serine hydrolase domain-containing protein, partial [Chloroflexota bacterium]|nr:serine hydrolase domain-containing protein [Chloroflexota bacterium]
VAWTAMRLSGVPQTVDALHRILDDFVRGTAAGAVVSLCRGNDTGAEAAAGVLDRRTGEPMVPGATFRIASNTKTFTAAAILRLMELGRLGLDETLPEFLPDELVRRLHVLSGHSRGAEVTVRHLLQHTSGIRSPEEEPYLDRIKRDPLKRWTPLEQVELGISAGPPTGTPGARVQYSDVGYVLLSLIVERRTGLPLAQSLRTLLRFAELGLRVTYLETLEPCPEAAGPRMRQYLGDEDTTEWDPSFDLYGGGGLVSDAADLAHFWHALFAGRVFEEPRTLDQMLTTVPDPASGREAGLGVFRRRFGDGDAWFHSGFWGSFALLRPDSGVAVAGAVNQAISMLPHGAFQRLREALLELADR